MHRVEGRGERAAGIDGDAEGAVTGEGRALRDPWAADLCVEGEVVGRVPQPADAFAPQHRPDRPAHHAPRERLFGVVDNQRVVAAAGVAAFEHAVAALVPAEATLGGVVEHVEVLALQDVPPLLLRRRFAVVDDTSRTVALAQGFLRGRHGHIREAPGASELGREDAARRRPAEDQDFLARGRGADLVTFWWGRDTELADKGLPHSARDDANAGPFREGQRVRQAHDVRGLRRHELGEGAVAVLGHARDRVEAAAHAVAHAEVGVNAGGNGDDGTRKVAAWRKREDTLLHRLGHAAAELRVQRVQRRSRDPHEDLSRLALNEKGRLRHGRQRDALFGDDLGRVGAVRVEPEGAHRLRQVLVFRGRQRGG
mmetsp:Transcript_51505/g.158720  ORF Transcript_51505/g.158720 Transcript_51505/m.158720 type:complete len:369 (-) Transcript_51505:35-1141(-)